MFKKIKECFKLVKRDFKNLKLAPLEMVAFLGVKTINDAIAWIVSGFKGN